MNPEPTFLTPLDVTPLPDGVNWRLNHDLQFQDQVGNLHVVHAGFVTDFASIPSLSRLGLAIAGAGWVPLIWALYLPVWLRMVCCGIVFLGCGIIYLSDELNRDDKLDAPATLHDDGYRRPRLGKSAWTMKFYWDWILFIAMRANGVKLWKCWLIWFNVAAFGWFAWYQDGQLRCDHHDNDHA